MTEEGRRAFGRDPAGYERARPEYPEAVYGILRDRCGLGPGAAVFEIGPGTGKATRSLLRRGADPLVAVEPDERLATFLAGVAEAEGGALDIRIGAFEDVGLPPGGFDLGVSATAFHWLDQTASLAKVATLLRPGGWWAMWWNVFGDPMAPDDFRAATTHLFDGLERIPPSSHSGAHPFALDREARLADLDRTGAFDHVAFETIRWTCVLDTGRLKDLYATFSMISRLPDRRRHDLLEELGRIADERFGGRVERPMLTPIYTARRR